MHKNRHILDQLSKLVHFVVQYVAKLRKSPFERISTSVQKGPLKALSLHATLSAPFVLTASLTIYCIDAHPQWVSHALFLVLDSEKKGKIQLRNQKFSFCNTSSIQRMLNTFDENVCSLTVN